MFHRSFIFCGIIILTAVRRFQSMTQQIDPIQIKGLSSSAVDKLNGLANIKNIGENLSLDGDGTLSATGGGGGGGDIPLYSGLGQNENGALTQKASTNLLVHAKPDGTNDLIENNKITTTYIPDSILGQVLYGGGFVPNTRVATLTTNAQERLGVSSATITLSNDTTQTTGYKDNEGIYYIATASGTFASISFETGDWLISIGTAWTKVDNTDAVTGVKGDNEVNYRLGNVNLTAQNVGAVSSEDAVSTQDITPFVTTSMINDSAITTAKVANSAITSGKIDFTTQTVDLSTAYNTTYWEEDPGNLSPTLYVFGKIAWLVGSLKAISTIGANTPVLTIPSGYRPHDYHYFPVVTSKDTCVRGNMAAGNGLVSLRIDTSITPITAGTAIWFNNWWFIS